MPDVCELCGKSSNSLIEALVEGALVHVCKSCSSYGHVIPIKNQITKEEPRREIIIAEEPQEFELIISDYASKVHQARENLKLKQEELAQKIAEKVSVIHKIESGHLKPSLQLAKKLEHNLNIKLIEKYKEEKNKKLDFTNSSLTIGDLLKIKK